MLRANNDPGTFAMISGPIVSEFLTFHRYPSSASVVALFEVGLTRGSFTDVFVDSAFLSLVIHQNSLNVFGLFSYAYSRVLSYMTISIIRARLLYETETFTPCSHFMSVVFTTS